MNMLLNKKVVELNGFEREVAIKIENNKMYGVLNKTRFIWDFTTHELPKVEVKNGADKIKAAKYGRLYILKRLEMDNIKLPIKTKPRTVDYISIPESNGVWMNCFQNGYIRGSIDGVAFTWDPAKYQQAVAVNMAGFNGSITQKIDTNRIKARLREAGYTSLKVLLSAIKAKTVAPNEPCDNTTTLINKVNTILKQCDDLNDTMHLVDESLGSTEDILNILNNCRMYISESTNGEKLSSNKEYITLSKAIEFVSKQRSIA